MRCKELGGDGLCAPCNNEQEAGNRGLTALQRMHGAMTGGCMGAQVCMPVKNLDLGYNLVRSHDGSAAFLIVDHDEEDMVSARAPMGNIYAPGPLEPCFCLPSLCTPRRSTEAVLPVGVTAWGRCLSSQLRGHPGRLPSVLRMLWGGSVAGWVVLSAGW
jgi:hypothetical protein